MKALLLTCVVLTGCANGGFVNWTHDPNPPKPDYTENIYVRNPDGTTSVITYRPAYGPGSTVPRHLRRY